MVLGGKRDTVRKVAQRYVFLLHVIGISGLKVVRDDSYGFKKVYTPLDVKAWQPRWEIRICCVRSHCIEDRNI